MTDELVDEPNMVDVVYRDWLVARRSNNQRTSLRLHLVIKRHAVCIGENDCLVTTTKGLVRAAAALWQAAFLSDRVGVYDDVEDDDFLLTDGIIEQEFDPEMSARGAPDWLFLFHMHNARDALLSIASAGEPRLLVGAEIPAWVGMSYKECWIGHQILLDRAVDEFEAGLSSLGPHDYQGKVSPS